MPTDVLPITCQKERFTLTKKGCDAEIKSGFLTLVGLSGAKRDVRVVVYRTSLEHFAVIYPRKRLSQPIGVVNLRNTTVEPDSTEFVIRQKGFDNEVSAHFCCRERDLESWVNAFTSITSPCLHTSLPALIEDEETNE